MGLNIAYYGNFLRQGLLDNACNVFDLEAADGIDLDEKIKNLGHPIDFAVLESLGKSTYFKGVAGCSCPVALYCADSPLNEFWFKHAIKAADYAFADQPSTIKRLGNENLDAVWLPLPAQKSYFVQKPQEYAYDITFIGTINDNRIKRHNIIGLLQKYFKINMVSGVSVGEAQKIFSQSRITLNENLFNGLTQRILQGLAANSLVFTETASLTDIPFFKDGVHLATYDSYNILDKLHDILSAYSSWQNIAEAGCIECRNSHTSELMARDLLANMQKSSLISSQNKDWHELKAEYFYSLRYGGQLSDVVQRFKKIAETNSPFAGEALLMLGDIFVRHINQDDGKKYYYKSAAATGLWQPWAKLALLYAASDDICKAQESIEKAISLFPQFTCPGAEKVEDETAAVMFIAATMYYLSGNIFEAGFYKSFCDIVPDSAFFIAEQAWQKSCEPAVLDMMLDCLKCYGIEGELLPALLDAIKHGKLSDKHILKTAEIAAMYYDPDTANAIISAMKKTL